MLLSLARRLSNMMDAAFFVEALEEALARWGRPEIFNTDQGSQFTGAAFTGTLAAAGIRISMDSRGLWIDNVTAVAKHKEVYLEGYAHGREAPLRAASQPALCVAQEAEPDTSLVTEIIP